MEIHERRLLSTTIASWPAGAGLPRHAHEEWRLIVVLDGVFEETAGATTRRCEATTVILRAAGEAHADSFRSNTRYASMSVDASLPLPRCTRVHAAPTALRLKRFLQHDDENAIAELMTEILADALPRSGLHIDARVRIAREIILDGFAQPLRIADVAALAGMHPATMTRAFRAAYGCTPGQLLLHTRIRYASKLIATTPLAEVALRCGFYDQSHFANAFRRVMGLTARAYAASFPSKNRWPSEA